MSGLEKDGAQAAINAAVSEVKSSVTLDADSQSPEYSGHTSASDETGPSKSAK